MNFPSSTYLSSLNNYRSPYSFKYFSGVRYFTLVGSYKAFIAQLAYHKLITLFQTHIFKVVSGVKTILERKTLTNAGMGAYLGWEMYSKTVDMVTSAANSVD